MSQFNATTTCPANLNLPEVLPLLPKTFITGWILDRICGGIKGGLATGSQTRVLNVSLYLLFLRHSSAVVR